MLNVTSKADVLENRNDTARWQPIFALVTDRGRRENCPAAPMVLNLEIASVGGNVIIEIGDDQLLPYFQIHVYVVEREVKLRQNDWQSTV